MNAIIFDLAVIPFLFFTVFAACCIFIWLAWDKTIFFIILFLFYFLSIPAVRLTFIFNSIIIRIITLPALGLFTIDTSIGGRRDEAIVHIIFLLLSCEIITNWFTGKGCTCIFRWNTVIPILFSTFLAAICISISRIAVFVIIFDILISISIFDAWAFYFTFIFICLFVLFACPWVHNFAVFASVGILFSWIAIFWVGKLRSDFTTVPTIWLALRQSIL